MGVCSSSSRARPSRARLCVVGSFTSSANARSSSSSASVVTSGWLRCTNLVFAAGLSDLHAPSVDRLFRSASDACRERLVAIVMTGMGDDGSESIRVVKERGGRTIAESSESAIIFGMPAEAIRTGAVDDVLSLSAMPAAIQRLCP